MSKSTENQTGSIAAVAMDQAPSGLPVTILTGFGLGQLLQYGRELLAMDQVVAVMAIIIVIGLLADRILFSPWERFFHRRWGTGSVN